MNKNAKKTFISSEQEEELRRDAEAWDAHKEEERKKIKEGFREKNLSDLHIYSVFKFKKGKTGAERPFCDKCGEAFLADFNGDRILFEDQGGRLIMVRFKEIIAVCPKCSESIRFSIENEPDTLVKVNGEWYGGEFEAIKKEMESQGIKNLESRKTYIKKRLLKL